VNGSEGAGDQQEDRRVIEVPHDVSPVTVRQQQVEDAAHGQQQHSAGDENRHAVTRPPSRAPLQQAVA